MQISQDISDYLDLIDSRYALMNGSISRLDPVWGEWSREMNLEIKQKVEDEENPHPQASILQLVMLYWLKKSQLLEINFKSRLYGQTKRKRLVKEIRNIRTDILSGKTTGVGMSPVEFQTAILDSM